jgi:hypothetical protein
LPPEGESVAYSTLKVGCRPEEFRKAAKSAIKRLNEMRRSGDVVEAVTAAKKINLRFIAREPNVDRTLDWLDRPNKDDRIIASNCNERIQPAVPLLVKGDITFRKKPRLQSFQAPSCPASGRA